MRLGSVLHRAGSRSRANSLQRNGDGPRPTTGHANQAICASGGGDRGPGAAARARRAHAPRTCRAARPTRCSICARPRARRPPRRSGATATRSSARSTFRAAGPDHKPSGPPNRTHTLEPLAGAGGLRRLEVGRARADRARGPPRHGQGLVRVVPAARRDPRAASAAFETAGATVVFETVVDDYAEVWVNGVAAVRPAPRTASGQSGGAVIAGWNMPNRRLVTASAKPGERATVAIFAVNGPISTRPRTTSGSAARSSPSTRRRTP